MYCTYSRNEELLHMYIYSIAVILYYGYNHLIQYDPIVHTFPSKNSQQDLDKNLAWISARSCMISQEFGTPCYILLHLDKILSRFLWDFASCKISQDFGTYPTKSCNILLRSCGVFLQGFVLYSVIPLYKDTSIIRTHTTM